MKNNSIHYEVSCDTSKHLFYIKMTIQLGKGGMTVLSLPAWIPGSYMIRDFAKHIIDIRATNSVNDASLQRLDKQSWQLSGSGAITLDYSVYAFDFSVRGAHLDSTHAYFNGSAVFLRSAGYENMPQKIVIQPTGTNWQVATSFQVHEVDQNGFGVYLADNYEDLIDHPVEIGVLKTFAYDVEGIPHSMALSGQHEGDLDRLGQDLAKICSVHAQMFGELPIDRYLFLTAIVGDGYGGLEHRYGSSLIANRDDLPELGMEDPTSGYQRFLGLCSHEYFHLWNVKRIRPQRLKVADLSVEANTQLLWFFEGVTSYYDDLALVRSGCIKAKDYLELVAHTITRVMTGSGRFKQSVAESSFYAWTKFYKQDENSGNAIVSYYAKGMLVAFGLDLFIRKKSDYQLSLDDLMRLLWQQYGKVDKGLSEDGIERVLERMLNCDCSDFFSNMVYGKTELPLDDWFNHFGVDYQLRPALNDKDKGGYVSLINEPKNSLGLGAVLEFNSDSAVVRSVMEDSAAENAGLAPQDKVIAVNRLAVTRDSLANQSPAVGNENTLQLHVFRRGELLKMDVHLKPLPCTVCELSLLSDDRISEEQSRMRNDWLRLNG